MEKVVHIINAMEIGGVEVGVLSLLKSDKSKDYIVVTVKGCDQNIYNSLSEEEKRRVYISNGYLNAIKTLIKLRPTLIVSSLWRSHFISLIYKLLYPKLKRIHFVHSARFAHKVDRIIASISVFFADSIFCDSEKTLDWFELSFRNKCSFIIPMNVSFSKDVKTRSFYPFTFVYVGRFAKEKNIVASLDFIKELRTIGFPVSFDLYGRDDGSLKDLESYVKKNNLSEIVNFHKALPPTLIEKEMRNYNYYLQTSIVEGMSISVFQAIKNGLFPLVTPVGEISNYTQDGSNAYYLQFDDIAFAVSKFYELVTYDSNLKVGEIFNEDKYPQFDILFFETLHVYYHTPK